MDTFLSKAAWLPDGSGSLFMSGTYETDWNVGMLSYEMADGSVTPLVAPPPNAAIYNAAIYNAAIYT